MTIPTLPTWTDQEVQSAGKLNLLTAALEAKFAGSIGGADLAWPLVAQGVIDMNGFNLIGLKKFWNVFNADEYDDIQAAVDAAEAAGGSGVFIPPNNVNKDGEGMTISDSVHIFGAGKKSIVSLTTDATAGELFATTGSPSDIGFSNLVLDGVGTGSGQNGVVLKNVDGAMFDRVIFKNFTGDSLVLNNEGTAGNECSDIQVVGCKFSGGSGDHIVGDDIDGLDVLGCQFLDPGSDGIVLTPDGAASKMRGIVIGSCRFTLVARAVSVVGATGTANDLWARVQIHDNQVLTASGIAITAGTAGAVLKYVEVKDNLLISTAQGLRVESTYGTVCDNYAPSATGKGMDMTDCQDMSVENNRFPDAGSNGIDATNSDNCRVRNNDVHSAGVEAIVKDGTTGNVWVDNYGDVGSGGGTGHTQYEATNTGVTTATGTIATSIVIPANSVKVGDVIHIRSNVSTAGGNNHTIRYDLDGAGGQTNGLVIDDGTHDVSFVADIIVTGAATADTISRVAYGLGTGVTGSEGADAGFASIAVDWTTDITIQIDVVQTDTQTVLLDFIYIEIVGS